MSKMVIFRRTDWRFVTSGGAELTVGLMKIAFAGGSAGAFYARQGDGPIYRLPYAAILGGAGLGVSTGGIVSAAVSLPWAPGGGFAIYQNPLREDSFGLEDFEGAFLSYTLGATALVKSRSCTLILFGAPSWVAAAGPLQLHAIVAKCAGFGVLWGSAITNAAAIGISVMRGEILETEREQGETSFPLPGVAARAL